MLFFAGSVHSSRRSQAELEAKADASNAVFSLKLQLSSAHATIATLKVRGVRRFSRATAQGVFLA